VLLLSRIDPTGIIVSHFKTFYDARNGKTSIGEIAAFSTAVILSGVAAYWLNPKISSELFSSLLSFYAIIGGFLISALFIIITYGDVIDGNRKNLPEAELNRYKKIHEEIFSNTSFGVLTAVIGSSLCVVFSLTDCHRIVIAVSASCIVMFMHTLLLVLKRLDRLFRASL